MLGMSERNDIHAAASAAMGAANETTRRERAEKNFARTPDVSDATRDAVLESLLTERAQIQARNRYYAEGEGDTARIIELDDRIERLIDGDHVVLRRVEIKAAEADRRAGKMGALLGERKEWADPFLLEELRAEQQVLRDKLQAGIPVNKRKLSEIDEMIAKLSPARQAIREVLADVEERVDMRKAIDAASDLRAASLAPKKGAAIIGASSTPEQREQQNAVFETIASGPQIRPKYFEESVCYDIRTNAERAIYDQEITEAFVCHAYTQAAEMAGLLNWGALAPVEREVWRRAYRMVSGEFVGPANGNWAWDADAPRGWPSFVEAVIALRHLSPEQRAAAGAKLLGY